MLLYYYLHKKKHNCKKFIHKWYCILVAPTDSYLIYESCPYKRGDKCKCWNCPAYGKDSTLTCFIDVDKG